MFANFRRSISMGLALALSLVAGASVPALATETVTYTYDARGRLIKVERTGDVNDGAKTEYELDKGDNRKKVTTTGAPAEPASPPQT